MTSFSSFLPQHLWLSLHVQTLFESTSFCARPLVGGVFHVMQEDLHIELAYAEKNYNFLNLQAAETEITPL